MSDKTKIHDYACSVVNFEGVVKCTPERWFDLIVKYKIDDAVDEWIATEEGRKFMRDWAKHKLSGDVMLQYKEQLITHTIKQLTKLVNDGYTLEIVE